MKRSITALELRTLTGAKRLTQALSIIARRIEARNWRLAGRPLTYSGINWLHDYVLFSWIGEANDKGQVPFRYYRLPIADAMDCITGKLDNVETLSLR